MVAAKSNNSKKIHCRDGKDKKKNDAKAYDWLCGKDPEPWSRSHFKTHPVCDILLNNLCELQSLSLYWNVWRRSGCG